MNDCKRQANEKFYYTTKDTEGTTFRRFVYSILRELRGETYELNRGVY
jgi:hypothetical protein